MFVGILFACSNSPKTDGVNYFAKAGLVTPKFSNEKLNEHLKSFEGLFNQMGTASTAKDKQKSDELSIEYSDWILTSLKFKDSISREDLQQLDKYLNSTTDPWNKLKANLF